MFAETQAVKALRKRLGIKDPCKHEYIKLAGTRFDKQKDTYVLIHKCIDCEKEFKQIE